MAVPMAHWWEHFETVHDVLEITNDIEATFTGRSPPEVGAGIGDAALAADEDYLRRPLGGNNRQPIAENNPNLNRRLSLQQAQLDVLVGSVREVRAEVQELGRHLQHVISLSPTSELAGVQRRVETLESHHHKHRMRLEALDVEEMAAMKAPPPPPPPQEGNDTEWQKLLLLRTSQRVESMEELLRTQATNGSTNQWQATLLLRVTERLDGLEMALRMQGIQCTRKAVAGRADGQGSKHSGSQSASPMAEASKVLEFPPSLLAVLPSPADCLTREHTTGGQKAKEETGWF